MCVEAELAEDREAPSVDPESHAAAVRELARIHTDIPGPAEMIPMQINRSRRDGIVRADGKPQLVLQLKLELK